MIEQKAGTMHNLILNAQTLGPNTSFQARVKAASRAGYRGLSIRPSEYNGALKQGLDDAAILKLLAENNVEVTEIGLATGWLPGADGRAGVDTDEAVLWHMADIFKPRQLNCAMWEAQPAPNMIRGFGVLCDRAAEKGLLVAMEFIPHSGIRDMVVAWEIVNGAARPNGGLIFDTWHFQRGGTSHDAIATVPPDKWYTLQLSDAAATPWPEVAKESRNGRLLPGEGVIDFASMVSRVLDGGAKPTISVEVISEVLHRMEPETAARTAIDPCVALLERLGVKAPWWK
jgi:sugar phosphate isomerase/epimerase